jgi:hypothetical protein
LQNTKKCSIVNIRISLNSLGANMDTLINTQPINVNSLTNATDPQERTLANLKVSAAHALTGCINNIRALLNKRDIHTPPAIQLTMALDGYIIVGEGRTDKALLEDILNGNKMIIEGLKEVEVLHRMVRELTSPITDSAEKFHVGITSLGGLAFFTPAQVEK